MREKDKAPVNKIHSLELESLTAIYTSIQSLVEDEVVDNTKMKQFSDDLQELLRIYIKLSEFYTRLLKSYEDLD